MSCFNTIACELVKKLWQTFNNVIALQYYNVSYGFLFIILVYDRT